MHFLNSHALWLLWLLPLGVAIAWFSAAQKHTAFRRYGESRLLSRISNSAHGGAVVVRWTCLASIGLSCAILALARPVLDNGHEEFTQGTVDVIAVVDVSRSMAAADCGGTRLDMARSLVLGELMASLTQNRLGIVNYAGQPNSQAFLTDDLPALAFVVKRALTIESAPGEGSHTAWALARACRLFDLDSPATHKRVAVLFTDGGTDDKPEQLRYAINELRKRHVQLIVIGLGGKRPSPILSANLPESDRKKGSGKWYEINGKPVTSAVDEKLLHSLARQASGQYVHVEAQSDFHMTGLVDGVETRYRRGQHELYPWPLLIALAALATLLIDERSLRLRFRRSGTATALLLLLAASSAQAAQPAARDAAVQRPYEASLRNDHRDAAVQRPLPVPSAQARIDTGRDFGYRIGDCVDVTFVITQPEGVQCLPETFQLTGDFEARSDAVVRKQGNKLYLQVSLQSFAALPKLKCNASISYKQHGQKEERDLRLPPVVVHTSRTWDGRLLLQGEKWDTLPVSHWPATAALLLFATALGGYCASRLSLLRFPRPMKESPEDRRARFRSEFIAFYVGLDTDPERSLRGLCRIIREWYGMPALPLEFVPIQVNEHNEEGPVTSALNAVETALFSGTQLDESGRAKVCVCASTMFGEVQP